MNCNYNYHSGVQLFKELLLFIPQTNYLHYYQHCSSEEMQCSAERILYIYMALTFLNLYSFTLGEVKATKKVVIMPMAVAVRAGRDFRF